MVFFFKNGFFKKGIVEDKKQNAFRGESFVLPGGAFKGNVLMGALVFFKKNVCKVKTESSTGSNVTNSLSNIRVLKKGLLSNVVSSKSRFAFEHDFSKWISQQQSFF